MKHVASTTKKFLAAGGLAFSLAGFGLFASVGTAVADVVADGTVDSGSYDEQTNLAQDACTGEIPSPPEDGGATAWLPTASAADEVSSSAGTIGAALPDPEEAGCHHAAMIDGSASARLASSYPAGPSYPAGSSYPGGNAKP
jgi:hypothetical protein